MSFLHSKFFTIAMITSIVSVTGIYVLFGFGETFFKVKPKKRFKGRQGLCPGLKNLGSTCYLNSLLQALAPCNSVMNWLSDTVVNINSENSFTACLLSLFKTLNNQNLDTEDHCSPYNVIQTLRSKRWIISSEQQDVYELFNVFTETLDDEHKVTSSPISLFDINSLQSCSSLPSSMAYSATELPSISKRHSTNNPFRGLLANQLQCRFCGFKSPIKYDSFEGLSLSIPTDYSGPLSVSRILRRFISSETVHNVECDGCIQIQKKLNNFSDGDPSRSSFIKKLTIGKLPDCLCIHIQRTVWLTNGMPYKRLEHLHFPELLNMDAFVYTKKHYSVFPRGLSSLPHESSDFDGLQNLVGGKNAKTSLKDTVLNFPRPSFGSSHSQPVNLLKALHFCNRAKAGNTGFYVHRENLRGNLSTELKTLASLYNLESHPSPNGLSRENTYRLNSVIVHMGGVFSGHFVTYRRAPARHGELCPDSWLYCSDDIVKQVPLTEVLNADVYMLFYDRL